MRRIAKAILLASLLPLPAAGAPGRDGDATPPNAPLELIVVDSEGCWPCVVFKDQNIPLYQSSAFARRVPMRVVGLAAIEASALKLDSPLSVLPTVILFSNGAEIARLAGLTSPNDFLTIVQTMIERAE